MEIFCHKINLKKITVMKLMFIKKECGSLYVLPLFERLKEFLNVIKI